MNYKINSLKDKIYKSFIRGVYGTPKIPSDSEVMEKLQEYTSIDYIPVTPKDRIDDFDFSEIHNKFENIIDDIAILFDSVESESRDILDQLTFSLKENNGTKRELRRLSARANDIVNGRLGEDYLQYNFTESFDDIGNINSVRSTPVNTDAGIFTIGENSSRVLTLYHYLGRKLEFNIVEFAGRLIEYGYVGDTDAAAVLDKDDPRSLTYRIQTNRASRLRTALSLQLREDGRSEKINSVGIALDSSIVGGQVRLYYQKDYKWQDVPTLSIQNIKNDNVIFTFSEVEATHVKIEFIKDEPDVPSTNEYFIIINEIAIARSSTRRKAELYSKAIQLQSYSNEPPIIGNLSCVIDADIPDECALKVYVAQDVQISGSFIDSNSGIVFSDSVEAVDFSPSASGTVFLSDMWERIGTMSGIVPYQGVDFDWKEIKPGETFGSVIPQVIEFNNTTSKKPLDNSIFTVTDWYLFGDEDYDGPWPQYTGYGDWFLSGWCNTDNPWWDPYLKGLVESGTLISGVDVGALIWGAGYDIRLVEDPDGTINPLVTGHAQYSGQWLGFGNDGYPWNYYREDVSRTLRFGDYNSAINGWWRSFAQAVTPTGISSAYSISGQLNPAFITTTPDFYFNGINFYQIYRFSNTNTVIDPSIKLYTFQERPVGNSNDYYPHNFVWNYRSNWIVEANTEVNQVDSSVASSGSFENYRLALPPLNSGEEYIVEAITELKKHDSNLVFDQDEDFVVTRNISGSITGISLSPLVDNYPYLTPSGNSFDYTYNYRIKNRYVSTWTGFAIVSPGAEGEITFDNPNIHGKQLKILKSVVAEDLDDGGIIEAESLGDNLKLVLDASSVSANKHFKITIYCASDENTGFSARYGSSASTHWVPSVERGVISVGPSIKLVSRLDRLRVVDISSLLYDTPMNNDKRCALISNAYGEKILVAKTPSKDIFPGHYFDNLKRQYSYDPRVNIKNNGHWIRRGFTPADGIITYTTGSASGKVYDPWDIQDTTWNNGYLLGEFPNTVESGIYPNHTTYGHPINIDAAAEIFYRAFLVDGDFDLRAPLISQSLVGSDEWKEWITSSPTLSGDYDNYLGNKAFSGSVGFYYVRENIINRGFLYYLTAENLPTFYSISFRTSDEVSNLNKRFLYKLELSSDGQSKLAPKIRAINFRANKAV